MLADNYKDQQKQIVQIDRRNKLHKCKHKYKTKPITKRNQLQNTTNYNTQPITKHNQLQHTTNYKLQSLKYSKGSDDRVDGDDIYGMCGT